MASAAAAKDPELWRRRLYVPFYKVSEAARYARTSTSTVGRWNRLNVISPRESRAELTYLQLIEVAVAAAMRKGGMSLKKVKAAHDYFAKILESEFPFAEYRFKAVGSEIGMDYEQVDPESGIGKIIETGGQLGWSDILKPLLREFVYEEDGIAIKWHVAGLGSKILIDPQVAFGAPQIRGVGTWAIRGRYDAGESVEDIGDDLGLERADVIEALNFEGLKPNLGRQSYWVN
jgi:uncharacterized protein (DUF433 family)